MNIYGYAKWECEQQPSIVEHFKVLILVDNWLHHIIHRAVLLMVSSAPLHTQLPAEDSIQIGRERLGDIHALFGSAVPTFSKMYCHQKAYSPLQCIPHADVESR